MPNGNCGPSAQTISHMFSRMSAETKNLTHGAVPMSPRLVRITSGSGLTM